MMGLLASILISSSAAKDHDRMHAFTTRMRTNSMKGTLGCFLFSQPLALWVVISWRKIRRQLNPAPVQRRILPVRYPSKCTSTWCCGSVLRMCSEGFPSGQTRTGFKPANQNTTRHQLLGPPVEVRIRVPFFCSRF